MATKMVTDKSAEASFLGATASTFLREVSPPLAGSLSPLLAEGEILPDIPLLANLVVRFVESRLDRLIAADKANIDARANLLEPRLERDQASGLTSANLFGIRDICRGLYGRKLTARIIPDDRRIPQRPQALLHEAEHVLERLQDPDLALPERKLFGVTVDAGELVKNFEPSVAELRSALDEVDEKNREAQITQAAKDKAMAEFNAGFSAAIRLLESLAEIAGVPELADKVRPTRRRRSGGQDEEAPDEATAEPEATSEEATDSDVV